MKKTGKLRRSAALFATIGGFCLNGCSGSGGDSAPSTGTKSPVIAAFNATTTAINAGGGIVPNTVGSNLIAQGLRVSLLSKAPTLHSEELWNSDQILTDDPRCSGGDNDPHCNEAKQAFKISERLGFFSDPNSKRDNGSSINVFGRIKTALELPCGLSVLAAKKNGGTIPTSGSFEVTFDDATIALLADSCQMSVNTMRDQTVTITLTPTTDSTYYDSKVTIVGQGDLTIFLRINDDYVNISQGENHDNENSRTMVSYNRQLGIVKAEYLSLSTNGSSCSAGCGEWHRLYVDNKNKVASLIYSSLTPGMHSSLFALQGTPNGTDKAAFSFVMKGGENSSLHNKFGTPYDTNDYFVFQGCADQTDNSFVSPTGSFVCGSVTGHDSDASGGIREKFEDLIANVTSSNVKARENLTLPFTNATDIFTTSAPLD